jgi:DNA repair exonuclease SbcCD ATPase subunit
MTDDIVARLWAQAEHGLLGVPDDHVFVSWSNAADKIERSLAEIERLREEIQELKRDSTIFIIERGEALGKNADLQEEIERLRAALKHYSCDCTDAACCPPFCGHIARTALEGEKTDD